MTQRRIEHFQSLLLLAGISGAGKSTALQTLSDCGFYTIDNLPLPLLLDFIEFSRGSPEKFSHTALLLDVGSKETLARLLEFVRENSRAAALKLMFLDCCKETIIKRYGETRRPHPGFNPAHDLTIEDAIVREKEMLQPFKETAHSIVDTSNLNVHELRREVRVFAESLGRQTAAQVRVNFVSFGFKYGMPPDCDLVVDLRFLPNPYFVPGLREKTGLEAEVSEYVLQHPATGEFLQRYGDLLSFLLPAYAAGGKAYLNIGVGCTGGKHRSVIIAQELSQRVPAGPYLVSVKHRDLGRE